MIFKIKDVNSALILGANSGIGLSLVSILKNKYKIEKVYATYRKEHRSKDLLCLDDIISIEFDPANEAHYKDLSQRIPSVDLIINCIGTLHREGLSPEKSLKDISFESLDEYFRVNSFITPMLAKYFKNKLRQSNNALFCSISAKVGSIEDNKIGGWYGYRSSKAALNMFLKTIDIEFKRDNIHCVVRSIHPGTTKSKLSKPFIKNTKYILHEADDTAQNILNRLENANSEDHLFVSWDNEQIKW